MELRKIESKKGQVAQLPAFFQIMLLVVVFAGLTFIVLDKFIDTSYTPTTNSEGYETGITLNTTEQFVKKSTLRNVACSEFVVYNSSNLDLILASGNYTVDNCGITGSGEGDYDGYALKVNYTYVYSADSTASTAINGSTNALYEYGIGFLGIIILVTMVYLIIQIISGRRQR